MTPLPRKVSHKQHLSLHSLVAMTTLMAPTHNHTTQPQSQPQPSGTSLPPSASPTHAVPYLTQALQVQLAKIYDSLRGADELLSRAALERFLAETQHQDIPLPEGVAEFSYKDWLAVVWINGGFEAVRPVDKKREWGRPISNYYISSSHNTYLSGNQLASKSTTDAYKAVLTRGCRCIEIDVHNGEPLSSNRPYININGTTPSELVVSAKLAKDKYTKKYKKEYRSTLESFKGFVRKTTGADDSSSDEEKGKEKEKERAIDLNDDAVGEQADEEGSRQRSSSTVAKGEPRVLHAWTLTRYVGFREVCKAVRETAFLTTNLPLIVSLEVGCDLDQQEVMVQIMKEEWDGYLIDPANPPCDPNVRLPRLDEILNKILVKAKRATEQPLSGPPDPSVPTAATDSSLSPHTSPVPLPATLSPASTAHSTTLTPSTSNEQPPTPTTPKSRSHSPSHKPKTRIASSLSYLSIYTPSTPFTSFTHPSAHNPAHIFSISEHDILDHYADNAAALLAHNRSGFMRAYPAGFRVDSSNPDPSVYWRKGVQMVALNWQVWDEGTMLNDAMFPDADGWVLKPEGYRSDDTDGAVRAENALPDDPDTDPDSPHAKPIARACALNGDLPSAEHAKAMALARSRPTVRPGGKTLDLRIRIFAAQRIPVPKGEEEEDMRPKVTVEVHAERGGEKGGDEWKRHTETRRGGDADWGGELLEFVGAGPGAVEELCFVRFKIEDAGFMDTLAAWACVRLDRLRSGYRVLKLLDAKGRPTEGLLLVGVEVAEN